MPIEVDGDVFNSRLCESIKDGLMCFLLLSDSSDGKADMLYMIL